MKHFWIKGISILLIAGQISGQTMVVNAEETEIFSEESIQGNETLLETEIVQETETALGTQQLSNMETEKETLESQFSESELHRQADYRENSWRYSEGLWTGGVYYLQEGRSFLQSHPRAEVASEHIGGGGRNRNHPDNVAIHRIGNQ